MINSQLSTCQLSMRFLRGDVMIGETAVVVVGMLCLVWTAVGESAQKIYKYSMRFSISLGS